MANYLLGIDIGTTNVKSVLFDLNGVIVDQKQIEYLTYFPRVSWAEQDPMEWWKATVETIRSITNNSLIDSRDIAGIGVSAQAPTMLPVDINGEPLHNALIWMDRRAEEECSLLREKVGEKTIMSITGNRIDPYFVLPKILWFKKHEPDLFKKTYKILQVNGYINYMLTGKFSIDKAHASITQFYDVSNFSWSSELAQLLDVSPELFPDVYESTDIIGVITKEVAQITGLTPGTPVIAGTVDGAAAAVEAGVVGDGQAVEMTGTSTVLLVGANEWRSGGNLMAMKHAVPDRSLVLGVMSSTGASLKWFRDQFGHAERNASAALNIDTYQLMDLEASKAVPGAGNIVFLPYMMGERSPIWDTYARGTFVGINLNTTRDQIIRSILEGGAFGLYHNFLEAVELGLSIDELRAVGGGANSDLWLKIKASVLNTTIVVPENSVGAPFGDAILVGAGVGIYKDINKVTESFVKFKKRVEPNSEWHSCYKEIYKVYRNVYEHIKNDLKMLTSIGR